MFSSEATAQWCRMPKIDAALNCINHPNIAQNSSDLMLTLSALMLVALGDRAAAASGDGASDVRID